ncbi:MAG: (d)CMP kinase [Planctomycetaceae bacterium]|nr:(d)CMP kinase [Planctomycetaceae bacterium]
MIVTIDGPAGSGKSTVARLIAQRLGVRFLDTGAMYRAVALAVLRASIREADADAVGNLAESTAIRFDGDRLLLNQADVSEEIRSPNVTAVSSIIASNPRVRACLVRMQQEIGRQGSLVTEGRDQGTIVFPEAEFKFFLTASLDARAWRRQRELTTSGTNLPLSVVRDQLRQRDDRDEKRQHAPMKPADDARIVDTSHLTIAQVVDLVVNDVQSRGPATSA